MTYFIGFLIALIGFFFWCIFFDLKSLGKRMMLIGAILFGLNLLIALITNPIIQKDISFYGILKEGYTDVEKYLDLKSKIRYYKDLNENIFYDPFIPDTVNKVNFEEE